MLKACLIVALPWAGASSDPTTRWQAPPALQRYPAPGRLGGRVAHVSWEKAAAELALNYSLLAVDFPMIGKSVCRWRGKGA
jgi:hypothetical protein